MLLLKAVAAPSVWILFFMQAHRALLCTFTIISIENIPWDKLEFSPNKTVFAQTEGGCLKQCLEDFPECHMVITNTAYKPIYCWLCYARAIPLHNVSQNINDYFDHENIYLLKRDKYDSACPLVDSVLPV